MADWLVASDGETLAWRRQAGRGHTADRGVSALPERSAAALCDALRAAMAGSAQRGDTLRLVLGSLFMPAAALPWPRDRLSAAEQAALLRRQWADQLDDAAHCWLGVESSGLVRLATAINRDLLGALDAVVAAAGLRPGACLPAAGLALRHAGRGDHARLLLEEGPRETLMDLANDRLVTLRSRWRAPVGAALRSAALGNAIPGDAIPADAASGQAIHDADSAAVGGASGQPGMQPPPPATRRLGGGPHVWLDWVEAT